MNPTNPPSDPASTDPPVNTPSIAPIDIKGYSFQLKDHLASLSIAEDDLCERIKTYVAVMSHHGIEKNCIIRIFDEEPFDEAQASEEDFEPGYVGRFEEEVQTAQKLLTSSCTLKPLAPRKLRKAVIGAGRHGHIRRTVLVYNKPDGEDWVALQEQLLDPPRHSAIKEAFTSAIQELLDAGYYICHDYYYYVLWSAAQRKCIFLNLALAQKVPKGCEKIEPEYELAAWAFPSEPEEEAS